MLEIKNYVRNPFRVEAVRVTSENMQAVADHCGGSIEDGSTDGLGSYIKVDVLRPVNDRQCRAYDGDWILKAGNGFKVYTNSAFMNTFQPEKEEIDLAQMINTNAEVGIPVVSEGGDDEALFALIRESIRKAVQSEVTRVIMNSSFSSIQDMRKQRGASNMITPNVMPNFSRTVNSLKEASAKVAEISETLRENHSQR